MKDKIQAIFDEHLAVTQRSAQQLNEIIYNACNLIINCIKTGNKVLIFGNGGSASDAQHIAAEFTGRFVKERKGLPAIALTTDTSALTAISNDYGFDKVFQRQVEALAQKGDLLIGLSTSGNSQNVVNGLLAGKNSGCQTIGLSGRDGGLMNDSCDINIIVPAGSTAHIQEMHILIGHIICSIIDDNF